MILENETVYIGSTQNQLFSYDITNKRINQRFFSFVNENKILYFHVSKNILVCGNIDNHIRMWDTNSGDCLCQISTNNCVEKVFIIKNSERIELLLQSNGILSLIFI